MAAKMAAATVCEDKLISCNDCPARYLRSKAHTKEWCDFLMRPNFEDTGLPKPLSCHPCAVGHKAVMEVVAEDPEIPPTLVSYPVVLVSRETLKMWDAGVGVGDAVWLHHVNGTKSAAIVHLFDQLALFSCIFRPANFPANSLLIVTTGSTPTLNATKVVFELVAKKEWSKDSAFLHVVKLKLFGRPIYIGQVVTVEYKDAQMKLGIKAIATAAEENVSETEEFQVYSVTEETELHEGTGEYVCDTVTAKAVLEDVDEEMTFERIGGCFKAKSDLKSFLIDPLRQDPPRTPHCLAFLIYGVSGTGKSLLGKSLQRETNLATEFITTTEGLRQKMTKSSKGSAPTLLVADNFDSLVEGKAARDQQSLQTLWCEALDSFRSTRQLFVAITNRLESIDSRLRGRFDVEVEVMVPNEVERGDILTRLLSGFAHSLSAADCELVSGKAHGYTGRSLDIVCRQAADKAARRNEPISRADLMESLGRLESYSRPRD